MKSNPFFPNQVYLLLLRDIPLLFLLVYPQKDQVYIGHPRAYSLSEFEHRLFQKNS